jgi:hypothetical protein
MAGSLAGLLVLTGCGTGEQNMPVFDTQLCVVSAFPAQHSMLHEHGL